MNNFQRIGACLYKENRNFYHLHKNCVFKFGCTMIFVLIQILCDKNYKCKKKSSSTIDSDSDSIENDRKTLPKHIKKEKVTFTDQPQSLNVPTTSETINFGNQTSILRSPHSCKPNISETVTFDNQTSTLQFPPSFNLKSDEKSTPKPSANLNNTCRIDLDCLPQNNFISPTRQNNLVFSRKIQAQVHQEDPNLINQTNDSFHSC